MSGVPGTGKTATIRAVAKQLGEDQDLGAARFDFIEINAMALTTPEHAYSLIWNVVGKKVYYSAVGTYS